MAIRDIFKVSRKTFLNPSAWLDLSGLIAQTKTIGSALSGIFSTPPATPSDELPESFEDAAKRQGLTEKDILDGISTYRALAFVFVLLGALSVSYAVYLVIRYGSFTGGMLGLAVAALFFSQMFKYDFWALQMRRRQLGLTFADWKRQYLG